MAKKIQRVSDCRHSPVNAKATRPAQRRVAIQACPERKSGNAAPAKNNKTLKIEIARSVADGCSGSDEFSVATLMVVNLVN
jgi:hypothetical protein